MMSGEYAPNYVPTVFVEMPASPPPPPKIEESKGGIVISRGFLAIVAILLFGALVASTGLLFMQLQGQKADAKRIQDGLQTQLTAAQTSTQSLTLAKTQLTAERDTLNQRIVKYGAIEGQLNDAAAQSKLITDLLATDAKKGFGKAGIDPKAKEHTASLAVLDDAKWKEDAESTLRKKVTALKALYDEILRWAPAGPSTGPVAIPEGTIKTTPH